MVDDFGVKYVGKENDDHLIKVLEENYNLTKYWSGEKYAGLTMTWDYIKREVNLTMPGYVAKALHRFQQNSHPKMQHQPHPYVPPNYGA